MKKLTKLLSVLTAAGILASMPAVTAYAENREQKIRVIIENNTLSAEDGGQMGGWMFTLDDWITDEGISAYTVSSGKLEAGDEIKFVYSCAWGGDIGYDWSGSDTSLSGAELSAGTLTPEFSGDNFDYILELPADTDKITIRPHTVNKAYRAKVYKNNYTPHWYWSI